MDKDTSTRRPEAASADVAYRYGAGEAPGVWREGEVTLDILAVLGVVHRRWKTLALIIFAFLLIGWIYAKLLPNVYRAEALLVPTKQYGASSRAGGLGESLKGLAPIMGISIPASDTEIDLNYALTVMGTKPFRVRAVEEMRLVPFLINITKMKYVPDEEQKLEMAVDRLGGSLYIKKGEKVTSPIYTFGVSDRSPAVSLYLTNKMIGAINSYMRDDTVKRATNEIAFLAEQAEKESMTDMKLILFSLIMEKKKQIALAEARPDYLFRVINPPELPKARIAPKRLLIVAMFFLGGILVAFPAILVMEVMQKGYSHLIKRV